MYYHLKQTVVDTNSCNATEKENTSKNGAVLKSQRVRFSLKIFVMLAVAMCIGFMSCNDGEDPIVGPSNKYETCDDIKSEISLFTTLKLNVTDNHLRNYNNARIQVKYTNYYTISLGWDENGNYNPEYAIYDVVDGTEPVQKYFLVAEAEEQNPTLNLKDVPDEYLIKINIPKKTDFYNGLYDLMGHNEYLESSIKISNENAKIAFGDAFVGGNLSIGTPDGIWNTSGVRVDVMSIGSGTLGDVEAWGEGQLVYCNTDCNITGELGFMRQGWEDEDITVVKDGIIDIRLKKGWNKIFSIYGCDGNKVITLGIDNLEFVMGAG